ncbi:glycine zipper 2TM domain-containing protein [Sphingobium nicotianae]|uniref:17 kDa surface antigen n=1 Tax=Sphingobium nicotianae TaxID=2782607 RepID=A0A9X1DDG2_9SPHN|nr:glycine zipper 2TM domain-containing protein [Sphingobium nicotianae]MBT2187865.1 glycine zipper 2TM domain-containing protein [Sphingobium nicotianae]
MFKGLNKAITAFALGATALGGIAATPAFADPPEGRGWRKHDDDRRDWRDDRRDRRDDRRDWRDDRRDDRRDWRDDHRRGPVIVYNYDYNRPDPRYRGGYYANRYYRPYNRYGYRPIIVTRETRIYRGDDDRYYCRRSDGTTGLIVGAVLGGVIGNSIDRGRSSVLGTVLGAGAGAALGQSIDRGSVQCR